MNISLYHDRRQKNSSGRYVLKVQVYGQDQAGKTIRKYYSLSKICLTAYGTKGLTEKEFDKVFHGHHPRGKEQKLLMAINKELLRAQTILNEQQSFSLSDFERQYLGISKETVRDYFQDYIAKCHARDRYKSAQSYQVALRCLLEYNQHTRNGEEIYFNQITKTFLNDYDHWMRSQKVKSKSSGAERNRFSINTISIYMRNLRTIFNQAIEDGVVKQAAYPFGASSNKYTIPSSVNSKRALSQEQLKALWLVPTHNEYERRAKLYWFLIYSLNGINLADLAEVKQASYFEGILRFQRSKTRGAGKGTVRTISLPITAFAKEIMQELRVDSDDPDDFLLPIYTQEMTVKERNKSRSSILYNINANLKKLSPRANLNFHVTSYHARHSYATSALSSGANLHDIKETLGHSDLKTTLNYIASIEDARRLEISEKVTGFLNS